MNKFLAFLKLIRFPNLIMIVLAQYITSIKFVKTIDNSQLMLISLATIFIAMGGYVLNDIEDIKIDTINKKEPVTKIFSISLLKIYYYSFSIIGLAVSFYISYHSKIWFIMFFGFAFFLLWSYAKFFSKFKLIGNIFVSFLIAEAIIIVPIIANITNNTPTPTEEIYKVVLPSYILLAFLFNWMREVIKDLEDQKGDELENRITVPSVFGTEPAKMVVFALVFMASPLIILQLWKLHYNVLGIVILLVAILIYRLKIAKKTEDFKQVSLLMKIIMLLGILYPLG
jgi:4-hydroxybenzoate polyprenyltransferase